MSQSMIPVEWSKIGSSELSQKRRANAEASKRFRQKSNLQTTRLEKALHENEDLRKQQKQFVSEYEVTKQEALEVIKCLEEQRNELWEAQKDALKLIEDLEKEIRQLRSTCDRYRSERDFLKGRQ